VSGFPLTDQPPRITRQHQPLFGVGRLVFFWGGSSFFLEHPMKKRITFEMDEIMEVKIKALAGGKSYMSSKDYQNIISSLVERSYANLKR